MPLTDVQKTFPRVSWRLQKCAGAYGKTDRPMTPSQDYRSLEILRSCHQSHWSVDHSGQDKRKWS